MSAAKPKRGRPSTMDAEKLQDIAMMAYWQDEPCAVSVNAICQQAKVAKPSLYRIFGNEDGLMDAALARYADTVLADVLWIVQRGDSLAVTLAALADFACEDPRMAKNCLFYKMRAAKHHLGPKTQARIAALDAAAQAAYAGFLQRCMAEGRWSATLPLETAALYLKEQVALAITLRAAGHPSATLRACLEAAFTVIRAD